MLKPFGLIVWSRYRAAQLDLLLSSLERFCPDQFQTYVVTKLDPHTKEAYEKCFNMHPWAEMVEEIDFNKQTKEILKRHPYMGVSTDDTVVFRPFVLMEDDMRDVDIFSLRYGFNTTVQDPFSQRMQPALLKYEDEGETIKWDSRLYHPLNNYGFVFGHDLHVYSKRYSEIVDELDFNRTNQLESTLFQYRNRINPFIRSFKHSVAVNIPGNNTSGVTETDNSLPLEEINEKFINGYRFDLGDILKEKIVGCHQLVGIRMVKYE